MKTRCVSKSPPWTKALSRRTVALLPRMLRREVGCLLRSAVTQGIVCRTPLNRRLTTAGLEDRPCRQTRHSNCPKHVEKAVSNESLSRRRFWKKKSAQSKVLNISESPS